MVRVRFLPSGRSARVQPGTPLLRAALQSGMPLASACDGAGVCRACKVFVTEGEANLTPPSDDERRAADEQHLARGERFACHAKVLGPVTITTTYW